MENFLQQKLFDNTVEHYLYVVGVIVVVLLLKRLIAKYLAKSLHRLIARHAKNIDRNAFLNLVVQPLDVFLVLLISFIAADSLSFPVSWNISVYHITLRQVIDSAAAALMIIVFIWLCLRLIDFIALVMEDRANRTPDQTDNQLVVFFRDFFKVIIVLIGILMLLRFCFNQDIGNLLTGLSIVGAALALATRESLENLIASFIIFFDKPFVTGDMVKVNSFTGVIEKIGLRSTRIRTTDKTYISVPNKQMVDTIVDNITLRTQRKVELRLEFGLGVTAKQLSELVEQIDRILNRQGVENSVVFVSDTGRNAHIISVDYFTSIMQSAEAFNALRQEVNLELIDMIQQSGAELAASNTEILLRNAPRGTEKKA